MEFLLRNLVLVFLIAGGLLHLFHRVRLPSIVALLAAGVLIGPHGLGVLRDREQIEVLAEIGILLLMFTIGLDFTRDRLQELVRAAGIGALQILFCVVVTSILVAGFVDRWGEAIFLGLLVSHTSSTLMLKLFMDRGEANTPPVRLGLGISITQDLSVMWMLLILPMLGGGALPWSEVGMILLRATGVFALAVVLAVWVIPFWMERVIRTRSRELFLIFLIVISLGTAWVSLSAGLSIGLGAFLAGIAIAESGYSHHTLSEVAPFRDLLISVFFIATGMLLDVGEAIQGAWISALLLLVVLVVKFGSGFFPVLLSGYPLRIATTVGVAIAQLGEFAFVFAHAGHQAGVMRDDWYAHFLLVGIASMIVSPFLVAGSSRLAKRMAQVPGLRRFDQRHTAQSEEEQTSFENHVVVAGYGLNGRNLATALRTLQLPFAVLDLNPRSVQEARQRGEPVYFGDASRADVLRKMNISAARGMVVAISDPRATRQAVQVARHENPSLHIIARTRYMTEIDILRGLGASEVIAEEFETSLEVVALTLRLFEIANASIDHIVEDLRSNAYRALRGELPTTQQERLLHAMAPQFDLEVHQLHEGAPAVGKSLRDLDLRARSGATLLAVRRDAALTAVPSPDFKFDEDDILIIAGSGPQLADAVRLVGGERTHSE